MRILFFVPSFSSEGGGGGLHERKIAEGLSMIDHLFVVTLGGFSNKFIRVGKSMQVMVLPRWVPSICSMFYALIFGVLLRLYDKQFDCIYVRGTTAALGFLVTKFLHRTPVVLKFPAFSDDEWTLFGERSKSKLFCSALACCFRVLEKIIITRSDAVIVQSFIFRENMLRKHPMTRLDKIIVTSAGVDIEKFKNPTYRKSIDDTFRIGYFGSLHPVNDLDTLLKCLKLLEHKIPVLKAIIVTNDNSHVLRLMAKKYNVESMIKIVEKVPHEKVPQFLHEVDVVVIPRAKCSSTEFVMPLKLFEAAAAGNPLVISKSQITETVLTDKENALLFEPEDPIDLSRKILLLYFNPKIRESIGKSAISFAKDYDWSVITSQLRNALTQLLNRRDNEREV